MNDLYKEFILDNNDYTLVDHFYYKDKIVNCYLGDEDYLFTVNHNGKEVILTDPDLIEAIKNQEGINKRDILYYSKPPKSIASNIEEMPLDVKNNYINKFIDLIKNSGEDIDVDLVRERLNNVGFFYGIPAGIAISGFYLMSANSILFSKESLERTSHIIFHEMIHASSGAKFCNFMPNGIIEGSTELTNLKLEGSLNNRGDSWGCIVYNQFLGQYKPQVALLKQMEYVLGASVSGSVVNGKKDFYNLFKETYGKKLYRLLSHGSSKIIEMKAGKVSKYDYLMQLQNKFMQEVFDKDILEVNDLQTGIVYMNKLRGFETLIGRDVKTKDNNIFEEYYNAKLVEVLQILKSKNVSNEEINEFLSEFSYKKTEF